MPHMGGLDLLAEVKRLRPATEAVLITGYASPDLHTRTERIGVECVIEKPFDVDRLAAVVADLAGRQRAIDAAQASRAEA